MATEQSESRTNTHRHDKVDAAAAKAHEAVDRAATMAGSSEERLYQLAEELRQQAEGLASSARQRSEALSDAVGGYTRENPLKTVGLAFVLGAVLAFLLRR